MIRPDPGGFVWLLRHELRLALRGTGKARWFARAGPLLLLAAIPAVGGIALAVVADHALRRDDGGVSDHLLRAMIGPAGAAVVGLFVLMVSTAALAVLRTFHDRGDLDLLLSAPLPPARVLAAKSVGVAVMVAAPFAILFAPFALTFAVVGHPRALGVVAMIGVDATLATAVAILLVALVFAQLGPRPARVAVQLGAALLGALVFLLSQTQTLAPALGHRLYDVVTRPWPHPLDWPARAALGSPLPLVAMVALAAGAAWTGTRFGARAFAAAGDGGRDAARQRSRAGATRFRSGLTRVVVAKELRLIARDPELISQIALRLVYLIPLAALLLRGRTGADPGPAIAAGVTAAAGLLASSLAWIVVAAEDAPDLLAAAPQPPAALARAKLVAACVVPLALVAVAALGVAASAPWAAAVTLGLGSAAAVTAALLQAWFGKPAPRSAFRRRQQASFVVGVGEIVLAGAWAGTASLLTRGSPWAAAPALLAGMVVAGAVEARKGAAVRIAGTGPLPRPATR